MNSLSAADLDHAAFVSEWQAAWNSHDLDRILAHYSEEIVFRSAKAKALAGRGELNGKPALRAYWAAALAAQPDLQFAVTECFVGHNMLVITYTNQQDVHAAETLQFDAQGLIRAASACHSPVIQRP